MAHLLRCARLFARASDLDHFERAPDSFSTICEIASRELARGSQLRAAGSAASADSIAGNSASATRRWPVSFKWPSWAR